MYYYIPLLEEKCFLVIIFCIITPNDLEFIIEVYDIDLHFKTLFFSCISKKNVILKKTSIGCQFCHLRGLKNIFGRKNQIQSFKLEFWN